jgi:hypothetical protein
MALKDLSNADRCALIIAFDSLGATISQIANILDCSPALVTRLRVIGKTCDKEVLKNWFNSEHPEPVFAIEATYTPDHFYHDIDKENEK